MNNRWIKILFSLSAGLYISLVCFNNITDYPTNFQFVRMVASMDDVFSKETNGWRGTDNTLVHHLLYLAIIFWELTIAFFLLLGSARMIRRLKAAPGEFAGAKQLAANGFALGVVLWFTVFITAGGEWFLMWQSEKWNAQSNAFSLSCCFLLFLVQHNQE